LPIAEDARVGRTDGGREIFGGKTAGKRGFYGGRAKKTPVLYPVLVRRLGQYAPKCLILFRFCSALEQKLSISGFAGSAC
jgi:hypothetical protein